ncbi:AIR synthase family protein [Thermococcus paralvinellae]|uniref:Hydrogenase expression/formation protein HypE n=1 Tax=Thermococcus paralvinellae TaxID=582419 RepID=W0I153_9EURY|nr:AIR synthase family protein [Thermococcus paralvinellae]AHF79776.1 Hydrogenase expression/formation protein HypE [Thermococcus paralvinellae]
MLPLGKIRSEVLNELILHNLNIEDPKVVIGPREGFDAAVLEYDNENYLVIATDPVLGVPKEHFGFFTYHFAVSDVAVFGAEPRWLVVDLLLPPGSTKEDLAQIMEELNEECRKYRTAVIGGHTGVYTTIKETTATTTALGFVKKEELRLPLAKPGDDIIITKGVGIEFAVGAAYFKKEMVKGILTPSAIAKLREMYKLETVVPDALAVRKLVRGMHDATEGGLTALHEIADNSNVGFRVYYDRVYIPPLVKKVLEAFDVNPLTVSSTGTLIIISPKENSSRIIKELSNNRIKAFIIGKFTEEKDRVLVKNSKEEEFPRFESDAYAEIY